MTLPTLDQLLAPVPREVVLEQSLQIATELGLPASAWQPVSIGREILYINAQLVSNFSVVTQQGAVAGGFLTYAQGQWLTLCAYETFDTERIESTSATGLIGLSNTGAVPYSFGIGDVRVLNEESGMTYTNTTAGTVPAQVGVTPGTLATTAFIADTPGASSNLTSTNPLSLVTTVPGVEPYFVEALIGQDEELDPQLRTRAREANAKASPNGPSDAYDYFAKTTVRPNGTNVGVSRTNQVQGNGTVTLYLADPDGALTTQDRDYVFDNVNANVVPTGFTLIIPDPTCTEHVVDIAITLTPNPESSFSQPTVAANIRAAIVSYFATIPIGGDKAQSFQGIYVSTLMQFIRNAAGDAVLNAVITAPAANVALGSIEIPVIGTYTPTWTA